MNALAPTAPANAPELLHGDELDDGRRPHHHARLPVVEDVDGEVWMLCGWRGRPIEDAAQRPCCPACRIAIGGSCPTDR